MRFDFEESREGFRRKRSGRPFHVEGLGPKTENFRTNSGESDSTNLKAESIRRRAESTGGCVKLKTVTEIRRSSAPNTFIAKSVYLVPNFLWDWEPVEELKQRCDVVSFTFFQYEETSTVLYATKVWDRGNRQARKERGLQ